MNWLLRLYPARWRERYGEEFDAVLASQRASVGLVLDVLGGAIDAHLYPQIQHSHSQPIKGDDTMTLEMLQRCAAGGPRLSPRDRRIASRFTILSALAIALYGAHENLSGGASGAGCVLFVCSRPEPRLRADGILEEKALANANLRSGYGPFSAVPGDAGRVRAWPQIVIPVPETGLGPPTAAHFL